MLSNVQHFFDERFKLFNFKLTRDTASFAEKIFNHPAYKNIFQLKTHKLKTYAHKIKVLSHNFFFLAHRRQINIIGHFNYPSTSSTSKASESLTLSAQSSASASSNSSVYFKLRYLNVRHQ